MKRTHLFPAALLLAVTTTAWAGGAPYPPAIGYDPAPTRTRAEVSAEIRDAQRLGLMMSTDGDYPRVGADQSSAAEQRVVRAKVHAETQEAARLGLLNNGESGSTLATPQQEEMIASAGRRAADAALGDNVGAATSVRAAAK